MKREEIVISDEIKEKLKEQVIQFTKDYNKASDMVSLLNKDIGSKISSYLKSEGLYDNPNAFLAVVKELPLGCTVRLDMYIRYYYLIDISSEGEDIELKDTLLKELIEFSIKYSELEAQLEQIKKNTKESIKIISKEEDIKEIIFYMREQEFRCHILYDLEHWIKSIKKS